MHTLSDYLQHTRWGGVGCLSRAHAWKDTAYPGAIGTTRYERKRCFKISRIYADQINWTALYQAVVPSVCLHLFTAAIQSSFKRRNHATEKKGRRGTTRVAEAVAGRDRHKKTGAVVTVVFQDRKTLPCQNKNKSNRGNERGLESPHIHIPNQTAGLLYRKVK